MVWKKIKSHGTQTEEPQDFSILKAWRKVKLHGTQTRAATDPLVLEKKKLHGTQTGFFWCADEFPAWKGDCRILKQALCVAALALWLGGGIELQGSQIFCEGGNGVHAIGKGIELQGAQTGLRTCWQCFVVWKKIKLQGSQTMYNIAPKLPPWVGRK